MLPLLNDTFDFTCFCLQNFKRRNYLLFDEMCQDSFCSSNALRKANYHSLLSERQQPCCVCPLNSVSETMPFDAWTMPVQSVSKSKDMSCNIGNQSFRTLDYWWLSCWALRKHKAAIVQYFDINFYSLDSIIIRQEFYTNLPDSLYYLYDRHTSPRRAVST